jgi:hypothetical protein
MNRRDIVGTYKLGGRGRRGLYQGFIDELSATPLMRINSVQEAIYETVHQVVSLRKLRTFTSQSIRNSAFMYSSWL